MRCAAAQVYPTARRIGRRIFLVFAFVADIGIDIDNAGIERGGSRQHFEGRAGRIDALCGTVDKRRRRVVLQGVEVGGKGIQIVTGNACKRQYLSAIDIHHNGSACVAILTGIRLAGFDSVLDCKGDLAF